MSRIPAIGLTGFVARQSRADEVALVSLCVSFYGQHRRYPLFCWRRRAGIGGTEVWGCGDDLAGEGDGVVFDTGILNTDAEIRSKFMEVLATTSQADRWPFRYERTKP